MNLAERIEHSLAVKVMRLTRPSLVGPRNISCEIRDLPQNSFRQAAEFEGTTIVGGDTLTAGQFLLLPQSFGNIYLGETFSSYICVQNCTSFVVENITVKVNLQSNAAHISLPIHENKTMPANLQPNETLDDIISYEVKEIGSHILICEVNYMTMAGLPQSFRKFFKFQVLKPLDVKTKFFNADMDEIYLEAQIQNITTGPFCLEKVELVSSDYYTVTPLNTLPNGESVFTSKNMLQPENSCQFLYCIKPKPEIAKDINLLKQASTVGRLDIVWRSNMGEKGCLQTCQLQRMPFEYKDNKDVRLEVIDALNIVKVGEPFTFKCRLTNTSERTMDIIVKLPVKLSFACAYTGGAEFSLGTIDSGQYREFPLTICPTKLGLIRIAPLILRDSLLREEYSIEKVVDVFVVDSDYNEDEALDINKFIRYDDGRQPLQQQDPSCQMQNI